MALDCGSLLRAAAPPAVTVAESAGCACIACRDPVPVIRSNRSGGIVERATRARADRRRGSGGVGCVSPDAVAGGAWRGVPGHLNEAQIARGVDVGGRRRGTAARTRSA